MTNPNLLRLLVIVELTLFIAAIVAYAALLRIIKTSNRERLIRLFAVRNDQSLVAIKEKVVKSTVTMKRVKIELFVVTGVLVTSLLMLWYLNAAQHLQISLSGEFYLLSILAVISLFFFFILVEYLFKKVVARIDELSNP